jgi:hypothetical protein
MPGTEAPAKKVKRWWDKASHHPFWSTLIAGLLVAAIVGLVSQISASSHGGTTSGVLESRSSPLRAVFSSVGRELFAVAFPHDIGLPAASEQWPALHARGGIDVGRSDFLLTLSNRSRFPLTVTNIEAVVLRAEPPPTAWEGSAFSQGMEPLEGFNVTLDSESGGATAPAHSNRGGSYGPNGPSYFQSHDISLHPGEIYRATMTVLTDERRELLYHFVISVTSANKEFAVDTSPARITNWEYKRYAHQYWSLGGRCWVRASDVFPSCG